MFDQTTRTDTPKGRLATRNPTASAHVPGRWSAEHDDPNHVLDKCGSLHVYPNLHTMSLFLLTATHGHTSNFVRHTSVHVSGAGLASIRKETRLPACLLYMYSVSRSKVVADAR